MEHGLGFLVDQLMAWSRGLSEGSVTLLVPRLPEGLHRSAEGHFHLRSELFLQMSGATEFRFPGQTLQLGSGQALLLPPRLHHAETAISSSGAPFLNLVLLIDGCTLFLHSAVAGNAGRPQIEYPVQQDSEAYRPVARWLEDAAVSANAEFQSQVVTNLLAAVLGSCAGLLSREASEPVKELMLVATARTLIRNSLGDAGMSVASLAAQLACTPDYLSHRFSVVTGTRLVEWVSQLRLERAAELLEQTRLSSKETAWACGFSNQSYFIRLFRQRFGLSPLEYRLRNQ